MSTSDEPGVYRLCTTCGKPAYPHPYRHPITIAAETTATATLIDPPFAVEPQRDDSMPNPPAISARVVSQADYIEAMRLLGLDPDQALLTVHIENGRITATYGQINRIGGDRS